jgi:hypothetical protein
VSLVFALIGSSLLASAPVQFDRIDVFNEVVPSFVNYDVPSAPAYPLGTAMRLVEQLSVSFTLPVTGLYVNASLRSQGITYEDKMNYSDNSGRGFYWVFGLSTRMLLPHAVNIGVAWRFSVVRVSIGVQAESGATWARPNWDQWQVLPTLGLGFGPNIGVKR